MICMRCMDAGLYYLGPLGKVLCDCAQCTNKRKQEMSLKWYPIDSCPEKVEVMFKGDSGYSTHRGEFLCNGSKQSEFRPIDPYRDCCNESLHDHGWIPTHWAPISGVL